jgi:hypothetical protein
MHDHGLAIRRPRELVSAVGSLGATVATPLCRGRTVASGCYWCGCSQAASLVALAGPATRHIGLTREPCLSNNLLALVPLGTPGADPGRGGVGGGVPRYIPAHGHEAGPGSDLSVSSRRRRGCSRAGRAVALHSTPLRRLLQLAKHLAFMTIGKAAAGGALCGSFGVFGLVLLPANITSLVFLQVFAGWALRANFTVRDRAGCMSCLLPLSQQLRTAWAAGGMRLSRVITLVLLRVRWVHG